jgi:hypothetical protein
LEANKALAARKRRPALTATTIKEALRNIKRGAAMKFASGSTLTFRSLV